MSNGDLPDLALPDDIVARLGRNLNQVEAARCAAMLSDGSAIIRRFCRPQTFTLVVGDVLTTQSDSGVITLPGRPILSVDSVVARSGVAGIPDLDVGWFVFDGIDKVTVGSPYESGVINLPEYWYDEMGWYNNSFDVTHTRGYADTPPEVKGLLCSAIISELSTPTQSATLQSETIGAYSYSMRRNTTVTGSAGAGMYAALRDFGMEVVLADFRKKAGTIAVHM